MKSKKQLKRYKNKSKKFRSKKTKGGGGNQSTLSSSKTTDTTNIETNPLLYRAMEVLGKQEGLPSIGSFYLTNKNIMDLKNLNDKWKSFGWDTIEIDGHNISEIYSSLLKSPDINKPKAIIAKTVKGKGFSFSENNNDWHHSVLSKSFYEKALDELKKNGN